MATEDPDEYEDYESGPYCQHWSELGFCEDPCVCGHACRQHSAFIDDGCDVAECECQEFKAKED